LTPRQGHKGAGVQQLYTDAQARVMLMIGGVLSPVSDSRLNIVEAKQ
jgi:hypothetical protein